MPLIYITGLPSSGKSTICEELKKRGFKAHDADKEGFNEWYNICTGKIKRMWGISSNKVNTEEWDNKYVWRTSRKKVERLARKAKHKLIFLCGTSSNEETVWDLFAKIICLDIDRGTLRKRITTRTTNDYGKAPHQLKNVLEWQKTYLGDYLKTGAVTVDANRPLDVVINEILEIVNK